MSLDISDELIEACADRARDKGDMAHVYNIDMENFLRRIRKKYPNFKIRTGMDDELHGAEAFMDCDEHTLVLSEQTLRGLWEYNTRAKFTVAHEIGHYMLGHRGNTKRSADKSIYLTPAQRIQEMQADKFASYFLIPTKLAKGCQSTQEIAEKFQVSMKAAEIAFERVQAVLRQERGERRRPPAKVIDFLKEAQKHGYRVKSDISGFD